MQTLEKPERAASATDMPVSSKARDTGSSARAQHPGAICNFDTGAEAEVRPCAVAAEDESIPNNNDHTRATAVCTDTPSWACSRRSVPHCPVLLCPSHASRSKTKPFRGCWVGQNRCRAPLPGFALSVSCISIEDIAVPWMLGRAKPVACPTARFCPVRLMLLDRRHSRSVDAG